MKSTEHKTTFFDVLSHLDAVGPQYAQDIGEYFWPDKVGFGPSRGGPSSVAVAASYLLGKLRARKLADDFSDRSTSNYRKWRITNDGREWLRKKRQEL